MGQMGQDQLHPFQLFSSPIILRGPQPNPILCLDVILYLHFMCELKIAASTAPCISDQGRRVEHGVVRN
ncbi:hypothetical protein QN277_000671 [Acacia crassicarpa]|uniref:Uncharacterized protein n=1 Tax=Acacia crassicarpa TaxID=499986 RepID=A0AAE1N6P0_9FABA|nr:hypothetical protein QN277_000671 [Acacia crassicarpa]